MSVLDELVAGAVEDQRAREQNISLDEVKRQTFEAPAPIDARQWLKKADGIPVIAEIKRASPSKGHLSDIGQGIRKRRCQRDFRADRRSSIPWIA